MGTSRTINGIFYDGNDDNITQLRWGRDGVSQGYSSPVYMHPIYGSLKHYPSKTPTSPFILRMPKPGGGYYTAQEALVELAKPNWGGKSFAEALPKMPAPVDEFLYPSDAQYEWHEFIAEPPNNPTWPTIMPDNGRGWECEIADEDLNSHMYAQNMSLSTVPYWGGMKIFRYRKQKMTSEERIPVPNPAWPVYLAAKAKALADYEQMLKDTFHLFGVYIFPTLQTNELIIPQMIANTALQIKIWNQTHPLIPDPNFIPERGISGAQSSKPSMITSWTEANRWTEAIIPSRLLNTWQIKQGGVWKDIPVMNDYWLAVPKGSWLNKNIEIPDNANHPQWDAKVNMTIENVERPGFWRNGKWIPAVPADARVKALLGIKI